MANGRIPRPYGMYPSSIDPGTLARTCMSVPEIMGYRQTEANATLEQSKHDLAFDIAQLILDVTGIFDPSPVSDGTNLLISLARRNWADAIASAVSIVPYIGDLAKTTKLPRYLKSVRKAIRIAKLDFKWAEALRTLFKKLKKVLDEGCELSAHLLPDSAERQLKELKDEIDRFLGPHGGMPGKLPDNSDKIYTQGKRSTISELEIEKPKAIEKLDKNTEKIHSINKNDSGPTTTAKTTDGAGETAAGKTKNENIVGTSDEAAEKALSKYNSKSIAENREYGGLVYKDANGQYGHTDGIRGSIDGVSPWSGDPIPSGTDEVGYWHTHGNYSKMEDGKLVPTGNKSADWYDSDNFSPQDIDVANEMARGKTEYRGYVGTPSGEFKGYDAKTGKQYKLKRNE